MNTDLSTTERCQLLRALLDIETAVGGILDAINNVRPLIDDQQHNELRAPLGTIRDASWRIDQLLFNETVREPDPVRPAWLYPEHVEADPAIPHGMQRPFVIDEPRSPELQALLDEVKPDWLYDETGELR